MKGLLRKDFIMIWKYCKSILSIVPLFLACSYVVRDNGFFVTYPAVLVGMLSVTLISYDERSKWNVYCQTFPLPRWKVVSGKYIIAVISLVIVTALTAAMQFVIFSQSAPFDRSGYLSIVNTTLTLALLSPSLMLPLVFKLGSEKARSAYMLVIVGLCGAIFPFVGASLQILMDILTSPALPMLALAAFAGSWLLSIRFYNKRDL